MLKKLIKTFLIGIFATGVNNTGGAPRAAHISANFRKNRNGLNGMVSSGPWGKPIHEKPEVGNLVALSL